MRPIAERHGLTLLQLACQWNLAHAPVALRRADADPGARRRRPSRSRPSAPSSPRCRPARTCSTADEVAELRAIGDNTGSMTLKGAAPDHEGEARPDRWALTPELAELAEPLGDRARPRPRGGMMDSLRGRLIIASPLLQDPNFDRTVVLITEHDEDGAMGLVLNRPSDAAVDRRGARPRLGRAGRRRARLRRRPGRARRRDRARRVGRPGARGDPRRGRPRLRAGRRALPGRRWSWRSAARASTRGTPAGARASSRTSSPRTPGSSRRRGARSCSPRIRRTCGRRCCGARAANSRCSPRCRPTRA